MNKLINSLNYAFATITAGLLFFLKITKKYFMIKADIGELAGKIWHALVERGSLSIRKIGEITSSKESYIFLALGWLAREEKIIFRDRHNVLYVDLK